MKNKLKKLNNYTYLILCYMCIIPLLASFFFNDKSIPNMKNVKSILFLNHFPYTDFWYYLFFPILFIGVIFILYNYKKIKIKELSYNKFIFFFLLLFIWSVISFIFSSNHYRSFFGSGYRHDGLLTYILFICIFFIATRLNKKQIIIVMEVFVLLGCILGIFSIIQFTELQKIYVKFFQGYGYSFGYSIFTQRTHYGYLLSMIVPSCIFLFLIDNYDKLEIKKKYILFIFRCIELWLLLNSIMFNATRAMIIGVISIVIFTNIFIFIFHKELIKRILFLDFSIIIVFLFLNTGNHIIERMNECTNKIIDKNDLIDSIDKFSNSRIDMWKHGIKYSLQNPLFGYGPDNLVEVFYNDGLKYTDRPHNELIQIAANLGIPALIFYLFGLVQYVKIFIKKINIVDIFTFGLIMINISYFICSLFSNSMFYTTTYFYMFLGFGYSQLKEN